MTSHNRRVRLYAALRTDRCLTSKYRENFQSSMRSHCSRGTWVSFAIWSAQRFMKSSITDDAVVHGRYRIKHMTEIRKEKNVTLQTVDNKNKHFLLMNNTQV